MAKRELSQLGKLDGLLGLTSLFGYKLLGLWPHSGIVSDMHAFTAVVEKCSDTGILVGYVLGFPGAHSQGETLDELRENLQEVISTLLEDDESKLETEFVGTQTVTV